MNLSGPDSLTSWMIAISCCFMNMIMHGLMVVAGILFVAAVPRFGVSREMTAIPFTIASVVRNLVGPLVGYLGNRFGIRSVTTFGCFLSAAGIGACYFAENIYTVIVCWGAVHGIGYGLGNILLPVSINQYFDKHRATASGISFSGACLGSFILPPILEVLISTYGLSGTFLFISGFVLNCVPAALLLKKPNFEIKKKIQNPADSKNEERQNTASNMDISLTVETKNLEQNSQGNENVQKQSGVVLNPGVEDNSGEGNSIISDKKIIFTKNTKMGQTNFGCQEDLDYFNTENRTSSSSTPQNDITKIELSQPVYDKYVSVNSNEANANTLRGLTEKEMVCNNSSISKRGCSSKTWQLDQCTEKSMPVKKESSFLGSFSIFLNPIFNIVSVTKAIYTLTMISTFIIIVDFARDLNIGETNEKYIFMTSSVSDLVGRLGLGWVTDGCNLSVSGFIALLFFCQGATTAAISSSNGFITLMITGTLLGLTKSGIVTLFPVIIGQYIDHDKQMVAMSSMHLLTAPALMTIPPLIGYFRDHLGSYVYLFYLNAILALTCGLVWLFVPYIARCKKNQ